MKCFPAHPHRGWLSLAAVLILTGPAMAQSGLVRMYELTELVSPDGSPSKAYAINDTGQVIGWIEAGSNRHSAHWHNQITTDLHTTVHFELLHPLYDQDYGESYDISNAGQVVGTARTLIKCLETSFVVTHAFLLRPAVLTDLGTPYPGDALTNLRTFGDPCLTAYDSAAIGISNLNHVVGWADREEGVIRAFLVRPVGGAFFADVDANFVNDHMIDLGTLAASDPVSAATAVNDAGVVTGYSYTVTAAGYAAYRAFTVTPNDTDLDGFGDQWYINGGGSVNTLMVDIGTLGGTNSWGRDINNLGHVVGESGVDDAQGRHYTRGFVWANGVMVDMGSLRSDPTQGFGTASAINDGGQVVGWADNDSSQRRAVIWENGTLQDLNDLIYPLDSNGNRLVPGLTLSEARDINQDGVIVGWGPVRGSTTGETRGFMLRPILVDPSTLPEDDPDTDGGTGFDTFDTNLNLLGIFGLPSHLAGGSDDPNAPATTAPAAGLCGATSTLMIMLTLAGLVWTRRTGRRG